MPRVANVGSRGGRWKWALLWVSAGSWLPAFPKGCTSPALCRQHKPRQQIPFEEAGFHSAVSPRLTEASHKAYKKKKREQPKGKEAPKPMTLVIYRSWQCYSCHCQAWEFISAWCYCPSPHVVNNSFTPFKHTPHSLSASLPQYGSGSLYINGVLSHCCFLSTSPESVI